MPDSKPIIHRASAAPQAMLCPASVHPEPGEVVIDSVNDAATIGTVVHECCAKMVNAHALPDFDEVLKVYEFTRAQKDEIRILTYAAWDFWSNNYEAFGGGVETEKELRHGQLSGHEDILSLPWNDIDPPDLAHTLDWKTTRLDINYTPQMLFYAWLNLICFDNIHRVKTVIVYLRDRTADIREWNEDQILEFGKRYYDEVVRWPDRPEKLYRPGGHCGFCRRYTSCPAQAAMIQQTRSALIESDEINLPTDPNTLIHLYERVGALSKRVEQFKEAVRAKVEHDGVIQGTEKRLVISTENRDEIDPQLGWSIMTAAVSDDQLAQSLKVKKSQLLKFVEDNAERGQKKKVKDALMDELRAVGAVETKEIRKLRLIQGQEKETQIDE